MTGYKFDKNVMTTTLKLNEDKPKKDILLGEQIAARRQALEDIDRAQFGWYHVRAIMVAGSGFFTDAYDIFSINMVSTMLGYVYFRNAKHKGTIPEPLDEALKVGTSAGAVIGQILFGILCDKLGRKKMYGVSLMIMIFTTLATALSGQGPATSAVGIIIFWRVLLGLGVGGDYPMSAVITSEFASTRYRGRMMAAVFSMQGFGIITAALVYYFAILAFRNAIINEVEAVPVPTDPAAPSAGLRAVDRVWRIVVGFGCIPAVIALYYRLTIPETPRYTIDIKRDIPQGQDDIEDFLANEVPRPKDMSIARERQIVTPKASRRDFISHFSQWKYGKVLLGTAGSWFMLDIAFYGLGLNNSVILQAIGYANSGSPYDILHNIAVGNLIIQCAGTLPGYWFSVAFIDIIGRKPMQIGSFAILTTLFVIIGFAYRPLFEQPSKAGFIALFVMCQFFMNFGANTTTFIVPGEVFPTRYRSTAHGISAASGKLGAIIAQVVFSPLKDKGGVPNGWVNHLMQIFALFMLTGCVLSFLIPETKGKTLEELSGEDDGNEVHRESETHQPLKGNEREEEVIRKAEYDSSRPSASIEELVG